MFVVFEGIDGSGKTALSDLVHARLKQTGVRAKHLREKGKYSSQVSESLRELGRSQKMLELHSEAEFLLYLARDAQNLRECLQPALQNSQVVILDRYLYTAINLATFGRHLDESFVMPIVERVSRGLKPDLVILVDVDPALARARRKVQKIGANEERPGSRKGLAGAGLKLRLREGYLHLAEQDPERWLVVQNTGDLEQTAEELAQLILNGLGSTPRRALLQYRTKKPSSETQAPPSSESAQLLDHARLYLETVNRRAETEPRVAAYHLSGLAGALVDPLRASLAERAPEVILAGLKGLCDDFSYALRARLAEGLPELVLASLRGLEADPRAQSYLQNFRASHPLAVLAALPGSNTELARALRQELIEPHLPEVLHSVARLETEEAWAIRELWLQQRPKRDQERSAWAQSLSRSLRGISGERAAELRKHYFEHAPIGMLSSLQGLACPESFELRSRYLTKAPKVIMASLAGMDTDLAWSMRQEVLIDCVEAMEGFRHLETECAWMLRERGAFHWPAATLKSLGTANRNERGRVLVEHQRANPKPDFALVKQLTSCLYQLYPQTCEDET